MKCYLCGVEQKDCSTLAARWNAGRGEECLCAACANKMSQEDFTDIFFAVKGMVEGENMGAGAH